MFIVLNFAITFDFDFAALGVFVGILRAILIGLDLILILFHFLFLFLFLVLILKAEVFQKVQSRGQFVNFWRYGLLLEIMISSFLSVLSQHR